MRLGKKNFILKNEHFGYCVIGFFFVVVHHLRLVYRAFCNRLIQVYHFLNVVQKHIVHQVLKLLHNRLALSLEFVIKDLTINCCQFYYYYYAVIPFKNFKLTDNILPLQRQAISLNF